MKSKVDPRGSESTGKVSAMTFSNLSLSSDDSVPPTLQAKAQRNNLSICFLFNSSLVGLVVINNILMMRMIDTLIYAMDTGISCLSLIMLGMDLRNPIPKQLFTK